MGEVLTSFGIDGKLFLAQIINFVLLLVVLWKFAYKPLLKTMEERTEKIESGLKNAEKQEAAVKKAEEEFEKRVQEAKQEAQSIVKKAEEFGKKMRKEMVESAEQEKEKIIVSGKKAVEQEKEKSLTEIKQKTADLVIMATEKILEEKVDEKKNKQLVEKAIKDGVTKF